MIFYLLILPIKINIFITIYSLLTKPYINYIKIEIYLKKKERICLRFSNSTKQKNYNNKKTAKQLYR